MESMVHIGNKGPTAETIKQLGTSIENVMKVAFETHMEQRTVRCAIHALDNMCDQACDIHGTTIAGSTFHNEESKEKKGE